jgi:hypothetical protein
MTIRHSPMRPHKDVITRRLGSSAIAVHLGSNQIFEFNETGLRIWERLQAGRSVEGIAEDLSREFDVEPAVAEREVSALVERLARQGLLEP